MDSSISYKSTIIYLGIFLFVTVSIHEVGHLVVARRLISPEARIKLFPDFPFNNVLGYVNIPKSLDYPAWKNLAVALAGPLAATIVNIVVWKNTKNVSIAVIASFFTINQGAYSVFEPLSTIRTLPSWSKSVPMIVGAIWVLSYALYITKNKEKYSLEGVGAKKKNMQIEKKG